MLSSARPGNSIVTLPVDGSAGVVVGVSTNFGAASSAAIVTGTRAAPGFDLRTCNSLRSYCRFQRNTWLAFTPFASAIPATLAPGSSVSFTILSFSSTRRNTRRFRPGTGVASMQLIVGCRSPAVQMGRQDAYDVAVEAIENRCGRLLRVVAAEANVKCPINVRFSTHRNSVVGQFASAMGSSSETSSSMDHT